MVEIGQGSHQLLVGVEVVRPGEIIARKDVLQKARTKNGAYSFRCVMEGWLPMDVLLKKTNPRKKHVVHNKDSSYLWSVEHLYP